MSPRRLLASGVVSLALGALASSAAAEDNPLGSFFNHLFNAPPPASTPAPRPSDYAPRPSATAAHRAHKRASREAHEKGERTEAAAPVVAAPAAAATPPPNATTFVYVIGDSLAISAADGMADDLSSHPEIGVVDKAHDASGLVRDDYFDWPKAARELSPAATPAPAPAPKDAKLAKDAKAVAKPVEKPADKPPKIDVVVVIAGINDIQTMHDGKDYIEPLTDRWKEVYGQRIAAVVAPFHAAHVPVIWVGLPPMRNDKFNTEMIALNQLFKDNAEKAGAKFLDIFDDFAAESGGFDTFGPNIDGQKVKLRGSDGIHLTSAGGKKLAHFIDVEVLAALGAGAPAAGAPDAIAVLPPDAAKGDINEQIRREMGGPPAAVETKPTATEAAREPEAPPAPAPKPEAGAIASLVADPISPGAVLESPASPPVGAAEQMLRKGEPPAAVAGRADDFSR